MPYLNKQELEQVIMSAFNEGIVTGLSIDHSENTPEEMFFSLDYEDF
ncbi:hypothetical protein QH639_15910 [Lysinibacillus sp. 1 U-2021]|nr:hypothetical protein [Lysinibacillus sp. 1 U-2021]WGT37322.1 hypothetical protein QH639_15910 [Lysinibacillus sp. 1 U-2021]